MTQASKLRQGHFARQGKGHRVQDAGDLVSDAFAE